MNNRKKRILLCNEASFLATGYAIYGFEVLKRLHSTGKYELAELACYGFPNDPKQFELPWKYYGNLPLTDQEKQVYKSDPQNQFGKWRFEQACLDFKPDIVFIFRDFWMDCHIFHSPFRKFYNVSYMPTVDAQPQNEEWISMHIGADAIFTYTDWAQTVLKKQGGNKINIIDTASPCVDLEVFKPAPNKKLHKQQMGFDENILIVGTVMRNQKRKLYPELIDAFKKFLSIVSPELAKNTFLYIHTSYPDVGWDIPRLIRESGIGHKIIFTYICKTCKHTFASFWADARCVCKSCQQPTAMLPNTQMGVSREVLASVINLFDIYVQYANSGGIEMPIIEAGACGVPIMATNYSGMVDPINKLKGIPIEPLCLQRESETHCYRAIPDPDDFVEKLKKFLCLPESMRKRRGFDTRKRTETYYNWDKTAKVWEKYFDSVPLRPEKETWLSPLCIHQPVTTVPANLSTEEFVRWGLEHVAGRKDLVDSYIALRMIRDLNWGASPEAMGGMYFNEMSVLGMRQKYKDFSQNEALQEMAKMCQFNNSWEERRSQLLQ